MFLFLSHFSSFSFSFHVFEDLSKLIRFNWIMSITTDWLVTRLFILTCLIVSLHFPSYLCKQRSIYYSRNFFTAHSLVDSLIEFVLCDRTRRHETLSCYRDHRHNRTITRQPPVSPPPLPPKCDPKMRNFRDISACETPARLCMIVNFRDNVSRISASPADT